MTMHILRGTPGLNTKKRNTKLTKSKIQQLEQDWRKHNKEMKRNGNHDLCFSILDDYIDYCFGKFKHNKEFTEYAPPTKYRRETKHYPSAIESKKIPMDATAKREPQKYTGTLIKGISTMHKSNAVPIIDENEAKEHARMRR